MRTIINGLFIVALLLVAPAARGDAPPGAVATFPVKFANDRLGENNEFLSDVARSLDKATVRPGGTCQPAALLETTVDRSKSPWFNSFIRTPAAPFRGHRIRITAFLKSEKVTHLAAIEVELFGQSGSVFASDNMAGRALRGTRDWTKCSSVIDVPDGAEVLVFGVALGGTGRVWADDFQIDVVDSAAVATTDDSHWHTFSFQGTFADSVDPKTVRNNHPTTRISSTADFRRGDSGYYDYAIRDVQKYVGKKVRMTAWVKSADVSVPSAIHIHVNGADFKRIANDNLRAHRNITGTTDWTRYEAIADVPAGAEAIYPGFSLMGRGSVWIDDVRVEVVGE